MIAEKILTPEYITKPPTQICIKTNTIGNLNKYIMKDSFLIRYLYIENNDIKSIDKIANILCKICIILWKSKEPGIRSPLQRGQLSQASAEPLFETIAPKIIVIKTTNKEFNNQKECI